MKRYELIVIGAGPAGLSAAIEAARLQMQVIVFDENARPGGQLFKQIHKFFGSREHKAKTRGFVIGEELLSQAENLGVEVVLNATVIGLYREKEVCVMRDGQIIHYKGDNVIVAAGASENMVAFRGWTLPGVIGAGAAQTMMNLHGIKPGERILMVGSGNVGLVVGFQLLQAGCRVVGIIDAAQRIGGYGVHAAKLTRTGVPFYLSHIMVEAEGSDHVTGAVIAQVDQKWQTIPGTEKHLDIDTVCIAVGLSPMSQLVRMIGCKTEDNPQKGGLVPVLNEYGETNIPGVFAAGDVAGIEEASSAMIQGRIAGLAAAARSGYLQEKEMRQQFEAAGRSLSRLRQGMFCPSNKGRTDLTKTDEGFLLSRSLLAKGYMEDCELEIFPSAVCHGKGIHPVIECTQNIPCNPCQDACRFGCIQVGETITDLPSINKDAVCTGCGMCVAGCSGQAIFLVNEAYDEEHAGITIPYEFLPLPKKGARGTALGRSGKRLCPAVVADVRTAKALDHTNLVTMLVPREYAGAARFIEFAKDQGGEQDG